MDQAIGFRAAISDRTSYAEQSLALMGLPFVPSGGAPTPFDGLDGNRLAGPSGSHPLAAIDLHQLASQPTGGLAGIIEIAGPVRVGEGISGRIRVRALRDIRARSAVLRLVGVRLAEQTRSQTVDKGGASVSVGGGTFTFGTGSSSSSSSSSETISWVEVHGTIIETLPFMEPALPAQLAAGQELDLPFTVPAPRLGPPTTHAGVAAIAWALEALWDIGMGRDERVVTIVDVAQHPDLVRAGVMDVGAGAMADSWTDQDASIAVAPLPPVPAGTPLAVRIAWPGAPGGRSARVELTVDVQAANSLSVTPVSITVDGGKLAGTEVVLPIPADGPPSLEADGLRVRYRVRVIVDRKLRSDVSRERLVVVG